MKHLNKYVCLVDNYRRSSRQRNTAGRYLVCAKAEKEAIQILQEKIGFGSIQVYYQVTPEHGLPVEVEADFFYKEAKKMTLDENRKWTFVEIRHCNDEIEEDLEM